MINGIEKRAIIKGGSVYIEELDSTFSKAYLKKISLEEFKTLCSFMEENELNMCRKLIKNCFIKEAHIANIFNRIK